MRAILAKDLTEKDARARDNKRFTQGRVLAVNSINHTVRVQVNEDEAIEDVPYTAQTPPNIGDIGDLVYSSSSTHSVRFVNPRLSSGNNEGDITVVGGAPKDAEYVVLADHATLTAEIQLGAGVIMTGPDASKPSASRSGRIYFATDTFRVYRDSGVAWFEVVILGKDHTHQSAGDGGELTYPHVLNRIEMTEIGGDPSTPPAGVVYFYAKADNNLYRKGEDGTVINLSVSPGAVAGQIHIGDIASNGSSADYSRADHQHRMDAPTAGYPQEVGATESDGTASTAARSDHRHRGLHSLSKSGSALLYGDVTLSGAGGISLNQVGQNIEISTPVDTDTRVLTFSFDGGGNVVAVGAKADLLVPYACTIVKATIFADGVGDAVVDIKAATYANYPTLASICASAKPTLSSAIKNQDATLTGWTTSIAYDTIMVANIETATLIERLVVVLEVELA